MSDNPGSMVRVTVTPAKYTNELITRLLGRKVESITQNPELRSQLTTVYIDVVKPYVPYRKSDKAHHLNDGKVADKGLSTVRAKWSATNKGYDYARIQYENPNYNHGDNPNRPERKYDPNITPVYNWTSKLQPGTELWKSYLPKVAPLIIKAYKDG